MSNLEELYKRTMVHTDVAAAYLNDKEVPERILANEVPDVSVQANMEYGPSGKVKNIKITWNGTEDGTITWDPVEGAYGYILQSRVTILPDGEIVIPPEEFSGEDIYTETSFYIEHKTIEESAGTTGEVRIGAVYDADANPEDVEVWSNVLSFTIPGEPIPHIEVPQLTGLKMITSDAHNITIGGWPSLSDIDTWCVGIEYWQVEGEDLSFVKTDNFASDCVLQNLNPNSVYYARAKYIATDSLGNEIHGEWSETIDIGTLPDYTIYNLLGTLDREEDMIRVTWDAVPNVSQYGMRSWWVDPEGETHIDETHDPEPNNYHNFPFNSWVEFAGYTAHLQVWSILPDGSAGPVSESTVTIE